MVHHFAETKAFSCFGSITFSQAAGPTTNSNKYKSLIMTPTESKLKRSPHLSQMTRTTDTKMMTMQSRRPGGGGANDYGFAWDFFELKRPPASVPGEQHSSGGLTSI